MAQNYVVRRQKGPRVAEQYEVNIYSLTHSNPTQKCRSNDSCPCRRILLCVEDLSGVGSSIHLRPTVHQNNYFSEAKQADSSGIVNCCF
ncbi:hypothetical protein TNCV_2923181 [Trichonephila clavipes]|nr:hypothetical protein TNCV_2923181 [Trichonephila clavipes]